MNQVLLDTHTLLWYRTGFSKLSQKSLKAIRKSEVIVSYISLWEIALLLAKKKIELEKGITEFTDALLNDNFKLLNMTSQDLVQTLKPPEIHKDPFDRLLVAQAINRNLTLITKYQFIYQYSVKTLW